MKILVYSYNVLFGVGLTMQLNKWKGIFVINTLHCIDEAILALKTGQKPDVLILNHSTRDINFGNALREIKKIDRHIYLVELTDLPIDMQSKVNGSVSETNSLPSTIAPEILKKTLYDLPVKRLNCRGTTDIYHLKKRISEREMVFLFHLCSEEEYTYEQIADKMNVHVRTVDGFRKSLFDKLSIKSKTGLVMLAIRNNWV